MSMERYAALILFSGIVELDTTCGPQILVSEPIVTCTVLGLLFGNPALGLLLGILFQFLCLGYLPLGGEQFTDVNMAAFIATASLFTASRLFGLEGTALHAAMTPVMIYGVGIGRLGISLRNAERRMNGARSVKYIEALGAGMQVSPARTHLAGMATAFCKGVLMTLVLVPVGAVLCGIVKYVPDMALTSMATAPLLVWGAVSASATGFYWKKGRSPFIVAGSVGGILWVLMATQ